MTDPWAQYLEFVELDYAGKCQWLERNIAELRESVMQHPEIAASLGDAMADLRTAGATLGALAMNELVDRLEAIAHEHGFEYTVEVNIATECMWGASVRLAQLADGKLTGRSIVFDAGGGQDPEDALRQAVDEALAWISKGAEL